MSTDTRDFQAEADAHGDSTVESCRDEMAAFHHAQECDGTDENGEPCKAGEGTDYPAAWHDEEAARTRIEEGPLSVEVRSGWTSPGGAMEPEEYCILLSTGGPASRIRGRLDQYCRPESACFEFQDWFKPWTEARLSGADQDALLAWAQFFYFGE